jgi:starch synthase
MITNFLENNRNIKILFVASEAAPFVKVGGLGEVMRSLPRSIRELGCDARVFIPKYATIDVEKYPMKRIVENLNFNTQDKDQYGLLVSNILSYQSPDDGSITYFLENMEYYEKRANAYGYKDDTIRWVLLSRAALEFIKRSEWKPDIVIASDWQTGFIPNLMKTEFKEDPIISKIASLFSIHNLSYQGMFDTKFVSEIDADSGQGLVPDFTDPKILKLNGMRRGILYADFINTVSPTYAKEILTPELGEKLDKILKERQDYLCGIMNGIDYNEFNPSKDPDIFAHYSIKTAVKQRLKNRRALQEKMGLPIDDEVFMMGYVGRLSEQKGINLLSDIAQSLFDNLPFQLIVIGTGDTKYKEFFQELSQKYPSRMKAYLSYDEKLSKLIFSGADAVIVPSKYEPAGLVPLEAMHYGAVPIVRKTGGMADSVEDYVPSEDKGTGFMFTKYDQYALLIAIVRAWQARRNKKGWRGLIERGMSQDFSWTKSAKEYVSLCIKAVKNQKEE